MYQTLHCIALRTIKFNDRSSILTAWSAECGRISVLLPAGNGTEARRRRALTMPLGLFEGISDMRPGKEILSMRDVRASRAQVRLRSDPVKGLVALFIADVLGAVLRESQRDDALTAFLFDSACRLDSAAGNALANFHLCFLYKLGRFLGIEPDVSTWRENSVFDLTEGRFRPSAPSHARYLLPDKAKVIVTLSRMTWENAGSVSLNRNDRNEILDGILEYYSLHHTSLASLPSLGIVRDVMR